MIEFDAVSAGIEHIFWEQGDRVSDEYRLVIDCATDPKASNQDKERAGKSLAFLKNPATVDFISEQLSEYERTVLPGSALQSAYDSTIAQVTLVAETEGWAR